LPLPANTRQKEKRLRKVTEKVVKDLFMGQSFISKNGGSLLRLF
jgi:hypothetical protein